MVAKFDENCVLKYSNNRKEGTLNADIWYKIKGENNWIGLFDGSYSFKAGQTVYFKGDNPKGLTQINETDQSILRNPIFNFSNGAVSLSGNVMALLNNGSGTNLNTIPNPKCFSKLFDHSTGLHEVSSSFLPAVNLTNECYDNMFNYCEYLNSAPILPATKLADGCYQCMFQQCKSLATPIELPAEALTPNCYKFMFFNNKKLTSIKLNYEGNFEETYFYYWVHSVVSEGILYYNGSDTTIGYSAIPTNFKVEQFTKIDKK